MRILMITSSWPTPANPEQGLFIVLRADCLRKAGVDIEVFPFCGKMNPVNYLKAWLKLRRLYNIEQFDLIDVEFGQSGLVALPAKVPIVVTFHGSDLCGIVGWGGRYIITGILLRHISRFVARRAKEVIVVSEHLIEYLPGGLSVHVIPGGVNPEFFHSISQQEARKQLRLPMDKRLVLFVADPHNPVKRYHLAQKGVELLKKEFDVDLVEVWGIPHKLIPIYMSAGDVLVLTSRHEGSPTVVKEALACNLPIVSVDVGDVRQRIGSVQGCVVCSDDSPEVIANGLTKVLRSRSRIQGRDAVADLDERLVIKKIIDVYHSAVRNEVYGSNNTA